MQSFETWSGTRLSTTGLTCITSGLAQIGGIAFYGTGTGQIQFFAGSTGSVSATPVITFCATSSAVAGGFSPMFLRFPLAVSGSGLTVSLGATTDPNIMLFWSPVLG